MKTDIVLIRPPLTIEKQDAKSLSFPLGLAYLGASLRREFSVSAIDCLAQGYNHESPRGKDFVRFGLGITDLKAKIKAIFPKVVGITCPFTVQFDDAICVAQAIKEIMPQAVIVLGGAHPSVDPYGVLAEDAIDFVVIGEGEAVFHSLCAALIYGKTYESIDGLGFKRNGEIVVNPKRTFIQNLDSIPFPARDLFPMETYFKINRPHGVMTHASHNTSVITSRGCPFNCTFCSIHTIWSRQYRVRSPENVIAEIKELKERYGIGELQFEDDNLTLNRQRAKKLFLLMKESGLNVPWSAPNGIALWTLDEELIELMRESGCYKVALGIESGDEFTLHRVIHKPLKLEGIQEKIAILQKNKIHTSAFFVVGFPQDKKENIVNSVRFASRLDADNIHFYFPTPYPGTQLYQYCQEHDSFREGFELRQVKVSTLNVKNDFVSEKELKAIVRNGLVMFWLRKLVRHPFAMTVFLWRRFLKEPRRFVFHVVSRLR